MIVIGLTGSIAMGKTTVAGMFADIGIPIFNADAHVHDLIESNKDIRAEIQNTFGTTERKELGKIVFDNPEKRKQLENILHPRVADYRKLFIQESRENGHDIVVLDIPLLFETGLDQTVDKIVVVSAPEDVQKTRALSRPNMTEEKFSAILKTQMPDHEKRAHADFIVNTHLGLPHSVAEVRNIVKTLRDVKEEK